MQKKPSKSKARRAVNLTIRSDVLSEAKALKLNTSQAAEAGIVAAVKAAQERAWLVENRAAIDAHNERVEKHGPLLRSYWQTE